MKTKETILRYMTKHFRTLFVLALVLFSVLTVQAQAPVKTQPRIGGAVFGGGRMADVGTNTVVTIVNCDTISAVYGGNDIAGTVVGANGSTIAVGTLTGNARGVTNGEINIGSVYGGGNGYYKYDNNAPGVAVGTTVLTGRTFSTSVTDVAGGDSYVSSGTIPSIGKTSITVNTDFVRIDSLFGGAKNAFITGTEGNNTYIDINGGVIYAVFGGNNFGGTLAAAKQVINVDGTKTNTSSSVNLGGTYANGRAWTSDDSEHGIRYLFGGGNKVSGKTVEIYVYGGQIDTLFGGGNSADVTSTTVNVNVTSPLYTLATSPYTDPATYAYSTTTSVFDIRCLFGGNNAADMSGLPTLNLTRGGVHNVYGGGNKGVMLAANPYTDNYVKESKTPTNTTYHGAGAKRSTKVIISSAEFLADTVYGGGQSAGTLHDTYVELADDGQVGVIYGGTNIMGRIGPTTEERVASSITAAPRDVAKTNVYIHGGTVYNTVFGASNGLYRCHNGMAYDGGDDNILFPSPDPYPNLKNKQSPSVFNSYVLITGGNVQGSVYSSGNMAVVGKPAAVASPAAPDSAGIALLHITGGTIGVGSVTDGKATITKEGNVFGGGNMGCVFGGSDLHVGGTAIVYGNVYGGNDKTGRVFSPLRDNVSVLELAHGSTPAAVSVNNSEYDGIPSLTAGQPMALNNNNAGTYILVDGTAHVWGDVYGGGNGDYIYEVADYDAIDEYLTNHPTVDRSKIVIQCTAPPDADQHSSFVDINLADGGYINRVFGGGNSKTSGYSQRASGTITEQGSVYVYMNCAGSDPESDHNNIKVGTIFGGNNHVAMNKVPRIVMLKGKVGYVYGGGNMGDMTCSDETIEGLPLSTYVATPSDKVVVANNIYGGCNVADVTSHTYVEISKGYVLGDIYGGNDLSGEVPTSHVVINGDVNATNELQIVGDVYGGGNGNYPFYAEDGTSPVTYYTESKGVKTFSGMKGRPYVDSTLVVLNGKFSLTGNVYGGGLSGDCRKTNVLVDADGGEFFGTIFGAGCGRVDNMGLRVGAGCKANYIGVAHRDGSGNIVYGEDYAMGNVLDTAWLTVRRFESMHGRMFGGGRAGNVGTTVVNYENTAVNSLDALYLGCLASDVKNAAIGNIRAYEPANESWIIDTIYGGNDFTGRVERTELNIYSGVFTHTFGAGNGEYDYKSLLEEWTAGPELDGEDQPIPNTEGRLFDDLTLITGGCADTVPYSMVVDVNVYGGTFLNTVYGGGNMGLVGNRDMVPTDMEDGDDERHSNIGIINYNIYGGEFHRHVFAGARGKTEMKGRYFGLGSTNNADGAPLGKQLAYAQKILNMEGGHVAFSVYGGSEAVDDGFPYECKGVADNSPNPNQYTTLRPSSIINITGGRIEKSVYGGGYQGNIYGSVYVNIGIDAVRDCPVWTKTFGTYNMADYKPGLTDHSGYTVTNTYNNTTNKVEKAHTTVTSTKGVKTQTTLKKGIINLEASIYNASDWGEAGDKAYFNTRGVFGGVTNILIDGKGYYTSLTNPFTVDLPSMDIAASIIGAGTSTEGGDVNRLITIRHYGDYSCPDPSKNLFSIQRADKLVLDSVFLVLKGEQDAFSAYASPSYSLCRLDTVVFRIDNILMIESPAIYIGNISSMKTDEVKKINDPNQIYQNVEVDQDVITPASGDNPAVVSEVPNDFFDNLMGHPQGNNSCADSICEKLTVCDKLPTERGQSGSRANFNVMMMRNGSYVKVYPFIDTKINGTSTMTPDGLDDPGHNYGYVYGWMFLLAQDQTMSYVYAETKATANAPELGGGFVAPCYCDNELGHYTFEIDYTNVDIDDAADYRSWKVGTKQGSRVRHITLVANAKPDGLLNHNLPAASYPKYIGSSDVSSGTVNIAAADDYAYATTYVELPPADGGSFYVINSVLIDQDNGGQLKLVDQGYESNDTLFFETNSATTSIGSIAAAPDNTFGLVFANGENFEPNNCWNISNPPSFYSVEANGFIRNLTTDGTSAGERYRCWSRSTISGNQFITTSGGYISNAIVSGAAGTIPTMAFTLTYNKNLHSTITRDVVFTMYEFDKNGNFVGPIEVTVTISTVIKDFADLEAPVLAMYNEGTTNEYVRKVTIPAAFLQRDVYIEGIEWVKDPAVIDDNIKENWFHMQEDGVNPPENNNHFAVIVKPTESASENINNTLGWYHIANPDGFDVYKTAKEDYENTVEDGVFHTAGTDTRDVKYDSWHYDGGSDDEHITKLGTDRGIWLGTLDGRSSAAIDISLKFNGLYFYHDQFDPPLAWVRLKCHWYNTKTEGDSIFYINVKVRTRLQGDTIYMAPKPTLTRIARVGDAYKEITMHAFGFQYNENYDSQFTPGASGNGYGGDENSNGIVPADNATPNYISLESSKINIKNNPNNYLQDLNAAMLIYDEGDVIDIMDSIPILGPDPLSVMGDDYSTIQIIRYSGSHYKFPTLACANYNPLFVVRSSGFLTMRNVWLNGSGCTRTKADTTANNYIAGEQSVVVGGHYFYKNFRRVNSIIFADAPMIYCHERGVVNFSKRVLMSNNFNKNYNRAPEDDAVNNNFIGGGAIAIRKTTSSNILPSVTLGDGCQIFDNVVVDWNAATAATGGTSDWLPRNYGAGIYVDGGVLTLGSGAKGIEIQIKDNYYIKDTSSGRGIQTKTAHMFTDDNPDVHIDFNVFYLDVDSAHCEKNHTHSSANFALSNVYLTRKGAARNSCNNLIRLDAQSDLVYFLSELSPKSKIGISKWFPGYRYDRSNTVIHTLDNDVPRDTISFARIGRGKSNTALVDNNYNANIFFNDSACYSKANGNGFVDAYPAVSYTQNTDAYPSYTDKVFIFRHTSLAPYNIYFQRCASFGKGVKQVLDESACFAGLSQKFNDYKMGDSISYHWNKDATCALATDTLHFHAGGGFFPYTYTWTDVSDTVAGVVDRKPLHTRRTVGSNAISLFGNDEYKILRDKAEYDTLVFRLEVATSYDRHNYAFEVTANDLTGNCPITQPVRVRVAKVATDHHDDGKFYYDYANYLQHRKLGAMQAGTQADSNEQRGNERFYRVAVPGVDSSSFHDHAVVDDHGNVIGGIPQHHVGEDAEHPEMGGIRRAAYTHHSGDHNNPLTAEDFDGLPYKGDGTDAVGDMTPRYLRLFRSYRVKPSIYPVAARGDDDDRIALEIWNGAGTEREFNMTTEQMSEDNWHSNNEFCPGEVLNLRPIPETVHQNWEFVGWNFDPSSPEYAQFVVGNDFASNKPIVFYAPGDYWWQVITNFEDHDGNAIYHPVANTATRDDYDLDYYGNVTIKTEKGLAWLISTVNGYNNQNAQTFHFNTITLNPTDGTPFDMSAHKWTPLGNVNNPFEGVFDGNGKHVTNIIVNETTVPLVGMFGHTKGATIKHFVVDSTLIRSNSFVSAIVGEATQNTLVDSITIQRGAIFGEYCIGGFIANMENSTLTNCRLAILGPDEEPVAVPRDAGKIAAYGNAIYGGGFVGLASNAVISNNGAQDSGYIDISKLSAIYVGGLVGYNKDLGTPMKGKSANRSIINNNYTHIRTSVDSPMQRVGGLVGHAEDVSMNNNYVYGDVKNNEQSAMVGGIAGFVGDNVEISNCYFVNGMADDIIGYNDLGSMPQKTTTFKGRGNHVILTERIDGYNNLTRALNAWVRDHTSDSIPYNTWRSDLENTNYGYPIFGEPDIIPVFDTLEMATCESFEFDGLTFDQSGTYIFHIVDSNDFVDSTLTLMLTINYGDTTQVSDTVNLGEGYEGHGFSLTADQLRTLSQDSRVRDVYTLHFIDSLQNANGCDSLVVLTLYVVNSGVDVTEVQKLVDVKVYPNPTRGIVNVEGSDLQSIEVYDNVSRRVLSKKVEGDKTIFDLNDQAAGAYYVRIRTANGTVVKKVIKK